MKLWLIVTLISTSAGWAQEYAKYFEPQANKTNSDRAYYFSEPYQLEYHGQPMDTIMNKNWYQRKAFKVTVAPAALLSASALTWNIRSDIREIRNRYIPTFQDHFDDVTQYMPALAVYGLNAAGIKGKHSIKRATVSLFFGAVISGAIVTTLKYTTNVLRPDGSSYNSFPSGHTASAVVSATFLHKEYGQYRDPLYSIGGYAFAAVTGIGRQLNNRHWISDVLAGAGIGLLGTELGYLIANRIYKDREKNPDLDHLEFDRERIRPSFLMAKFGYATTTRDLTDQDNDLTAESGYLVGLEGAYFINRYAGIGGEITLAGFPIASHNFSSGDAEIDNNTAEFTTEAMGSRSVYLGPYLTIPAGHWSIVTKFTMGPAFGARGAIISVLTQQAQAETGETEVPVISYKPATTLGWATGISLRRMVGQKMALNVFGEYNYQKPDVLYSQVAYVNNEYVPGVSITSEKSNLAFFSYGLSVTALIW